jgi:clan AA aspartic protease
MITGSIALLEPTISVAVQEPTGASRSIDAVIDTGFNGYLTLPAATITSLQLEWLCREEGTLADGSTEIFDVYIALILWDGNWRKVEVDAANAAPLIGMALLEKHVLECTSTRVGKF